MKSGRSNVSETHYSRNQEDQICDWNTLQASHVCKIRLATNSSKAQKSETTCLFLTK